MDTKILINEARARFNHNAARAYLKEKYEIRLILADQGGLWKVNLETINFLNSITTDDAILLDTFENPIKVDRKDLLTKLIEIYDKVMQEWHEEWTELEKKR
jgi:hypothetical protein